MSILIENHMPHSIRCKGTRYDDTRDISLNQLGWFIERDIFQYLRHTASATNSVELSIVEHDGLRQFRVALNLDHLQEDEKIRAQIEKILWSYNHQVFVQERGQFRALSPRFQFRIEVVVVEPCS